jgi:ribosome-associated protein
MEHVPTGIVVIARRHRLLRLNRKDAEERIVERVLEAHRRPRPRKPTRPTAAARERRLRAKRRRSALKASRRPPRPGEED